MTFLQELRTTFTELEELEEQVQLDWRIHSLLTRIVNMLLILLRFWKEQIKKFRRKSVIWRSEVVAWAGLDVHGVLALAVGMEAEVGEAN